MRNAEWAHIEPLIPPGKPGGGKRRVAIREVINGVMYLLSPADLPGKPALTSRTCLSVHASKLYHMGFRQPVRRSTLADANERRDPSCGVGPAAHHPGEDAVPRRRTDLTNTAALDSTTIALCLSVFPWAHFRTTKAAVKMPRCSTCGATFRVLSDGKLPTCMHMLLPEAGAITSWIVATSTLPAFMCCTKPGPSSSRVPSRTSMLIASIRRRRIARPASFATRPSPWTASTPVRITPNFCGASASRTPVRKTHRQLLATRFDAFKCKHGSRFYGKKRRRSMVLVDTQGFVLHQAAKRQRFANNQPIEFIRFLTGH